MTDFIKGLLNAKTKTPEQDLVLRESIRKASAESALSFFTEGPRHPNWSLEMQVLVDVTSAAFGALRPNNIPMTEDNFDLAEISKNMTLIRSLEFDLTGYPGKYNTIYWKIEHPRLLVSPDPVFDTLIAKDQKQLTAGKPRELYAEIVAHESIINAAKKNHKTEEMIFSLFPLNEDEIVMLHFHGGSHCYERPGTYRRAMVEFSKETGYRVFVPDYRLAPEDPFPAGLLDAYQFYSHLITLGFKSENIIIMGDSAGGNLILCILQLLKKTGAQQPRGAIALSPWVDLSLSTDAWVRNQKYDFLFKPATESVVCVNRLYVAPGRHLDDHVRNMFKDPLVSSLFGDYSDCAPIYVQSGEVEMIVDDIDNLAKKINAKEVLITGREHPGMSAIERNIYEKYNGMVHIFFLFEGIPECVAAIKGVGNFTRKLSNQNGRANLKV